MKHQTTLWFTRRQGDYIRGPFYESAIINNLLLGRLNAKDEVSNDQINWQPINHYEQFQSDQYFLSEDYIKKHLDERNGFDRRDLLERRLQDEPIKQRRQSYRRADENDGDIDRRQLRNQLMQKFRQQKQAIFWPLITVFSVMSIILTLTIIYAIPLPSPVRNCDDPAMPGVNWSNCLKPEVNLYNKTLNNAVFRNSQLIGSNLMNTRLENVDMAYADLRFANLSYSQLKNSSLIGANLKNANLSNADLSHANLSYANLTDANLGGTKLDNTRFDHAIWNDGRLCAPLSVGQCLVSPQEIKP